MKHKIHPILHSVKKHALLSLVGVAFLGIFSYTFITIAASSSFIDERVSFILSAFEANEKKYNLSGNDRILYYRTLRDIYSGVVNGLNMKLGEDVSNAVNDSILAGNQAVSTIPKQKYSKYIFSIRGLPVRVQRGDTLSGIVGGKNLIISCGKRETNDMVQFTSVYDGNGNGIIQVTNVEECMKKGKDLVLSTDHPSLCGLFGPARWSSQVISPTVASLDAPDSVVSGTATWTFTCVNPPGVQTTSPTSSNSTPSSSTPNTTTQTPSSTSSTPSTTTTPTTSNPPASSPATPTTSNPPVVPNYGPGCTNYNDMNWNCSPTSENNPLSCLKYGNNTALQDINRLQGGGGNTPESQKEYIRAWTNTDVTNLQFNDATGWATWGSSSNPSARCKIRYAVNATCGSAAGQPINRDPSIGFRMGADVANLCAQGSWKQTSKTNGTFDYIVEGANSATTASDPAYWENVSLIYTCGGLNGGADRECRTGKVKQDGVCGSVAGTPQILSCNGGILNTSKPDEFSQNGLTVRTYEKNRYDTKAYWDGEYNWECQGVNGGTTAQCRVENYSSNAACSSDYISRGSVDRITHDGLSPTTFFSNRTNSNIQFTGTCANSYPAGVSCSSYNFDPSKLCVVPYGFGGNPGDLVRISDELGSDGTFNWTCAGTDRFGKATSSTVDCTVAKAQ